MTGRAASPPFTVQPVPASSSLARLVSRVFARKRPEDAFLEVNNLFARAVRVRNVSADEIEQILARHGIAPASAPLPGAPERLYRDYLLHCLSDRMLSEEEVRDLEHLRTVLRLDPAVIDVVHRRVAREVYSRTVDEVLVDATIDESERHFLAQLREHLEIPTVVAQNILEIKRKQREARDPVGVRRRYR